MESEFTDESVAQIKNRFPFTEVRFLSHTHTHTGLTLTNKIHLLGLELFPMTLFGDLNSRLWPVYLRSKCSGVS